MKERKRVRAMPKRILLTVKHEKLKLERERALIRPTDVARHLSLTPQLFASYESGENRVPADVLLPWCALLKLRPSAFIVEGERKLIKELAA
jgi:transcriptional regulator with XRE-family HTH domain